MSFDARAAPDRYVLKKHIHKLAFDVAWMLETTDREHPRLGAGALKEGAAFGGYRCCLLMASFFRTVLVDTLSDRRLGCVPAAMCRPLAEWYVRSQCLHHVWDENKARSHLTQGRGEKIMPKLEIALESLMGCERIVDKRLISKISEKKNWMHEHVHGGGALLTGGMSREASEINFSNETIMDIVSLAAAISFSSCEQLLSLLNEQNSALIVRQEEYFKGLFGDAPGWKFE